MPVKLTIHPPNETHSRVVEFSEDEVTIGRSSRCDLRLPFRIVSGHHLTIFRDDDSGYQIRDEGSTNGTLLAAEPMKSGTDYALRSGISLKIVDMRIDVELVPALGDGFSLDKTGTMVRLMVGEALVGGSSDADSESAYFEIESGAAAGQRVELADDVEEGLIADDADALVHVPGLPGRVEIRREGDGFALHPVAKAAAPVRVDGVPLDGHRRLSSGDRIEIGSVALRFVDPLESFLQELDGIVPASSSQAPAREDVPADTADDVLPDGGEASDALSTLDASVSHPAEATAPAATETPETKGPNNKSSWGLVEFGVIGSSFILLAGVAYLLLVIFGVV